jgi:hypothetical protein
VLHLDDLVVQALMASPEGCLHRVVVLLAATDTDPEGEAAAGDHIDRGRPFGHVDGWVHGEHDHRGRQPDSVGDGCGCRDEGEQLLVGVGDALTDSERRPWPFVHTAAPAEYIVAVEFGHHRGEGHADLHRSRMTHRTGPTAEGALRADWSTRP